MSESLRRWRPWIIAAAVIVAAVAGRVVVSGLGALERGRASLARGDELVAALDLREAISWALPVAPWRGEAAALLWDLHARQVARGDVVEAVRTLTLLRAGWFAGRSLLGPDETWRGRVDGALAPLMARWEASAALAEGRASPGALAARTAHYAAILAGDAMPSRGWGLLAVLGFALWVGALWRLTSAEGRARWSNAAVAAAGFAAFLAGVGLA